MAEDSAVDFPIGISLGHKILSSAYYNSKNELQLIASIPSSEAWQDYFIATMKDRRNHAPYYDPTNLALSAETISSIVTATAMSLSLGSPDISSLKIRSISAPQQFNDISSIVNIMHIAEKRGYIKMGNQVMSHFNSARLAYGLDTCAGYGFPEGCDVNEEENFVFVVDLGTSYLSLGFTITGTILYAPIGVKHLTDFGQNASEFTSSQTPQLVPPSTVKLIQDFLSEQWERLKGDVPDLPSHLVAVILTGEASPASMEEMKITLESAIPEFAKRFKFTIDPKFVGVQGAAHRARQAVTDPYFTVPWPPPDIVELEEEILPAHRSHTEL